MKATKVDVRPRNSARTCHSHCQWISTFLLLLVSSACSWIRLDVDAQATDKSCGGALGLESRALPDSALSASSFYVGAVGPTQARLNSNGAWCPRQPIAPGVYEWIQVDLARNRNHLVTGVATQGRYAKGTGQEYTPQYTIQYARSSDYDCANADDVDNHNANTNTTCTVSRWRNYVRFDGEAVLAANSDTSSTVTQNLRPALVASSIRLVPHSPHLRTVCLRLELHGCAWTHEVLAYSMPQGQMFSHAISLKDNFYDGTGGRRQRQTQTVQQQLKEHGEGAGQEEPPVDTDTEDQDQQREIQIPDHESPGPEKEAPDTGTLSGGLGQLVDGLVGLNSFGMDIGYGQGNAWVGWSRNTAGGASGNTHGRRDHIEITFELDSVRRIRSVTLHTNNFPSKGVEVFAKAVIQFSVGGLHYYARNSFSYTPSNIAQYGDSARNETIHLPPPGLVGKFMRLSLFFRGEWLLISEVYFESEVAAGNFTKETAGGSGGDELQMDFPDTQSSLEILQGQGSTALEISIGVVSGVLLLALVGAGVVVWIRHSRKRALPGEGSGNDPETLSTPSFDCCASLKLLGYPSDRMAWRFVPRNGSASANGYNSNETPPLGCRSTLTPPPTGSHSATTDDSLIKDMLVTLSSLNNPGYANTNTSAIQQRERDAVTPPPKYSTLSHGHGQGILAANPALHQYDNYGSTHYRKPKAHAHAQPNRSPHLLPYCPPTPLGQEPAARVLTLRRNQLLQELERNRSPSSEFGDGDADMEDDEDYEYEGLLDKYARSTHGHGHALRASDQGVPVLPSRRQHHHPGRLDSTSRRHQHQRRTLEHESFRQTLSHAHRDRNERPI